MMEEMAKHADMSKSHMRSIARGDVMCPSVDAIEAMSEILDADMGMLMDAAERDGCDYSMQSGHGMDEDEEDDESMTATMSDSELKEKLTDKRNRIEQLKARVEELESEREQVAAEYAEALAADSGVDALDADLMTEKFEVAELAEMYQDQNVSVTETTDTPAVRSGDGAGGESASLAPSERQRKQELEEKLTMWEDRDSILAENETERIEAELAELGN
jgi:predicted RNase H-like nuclease (RuvC/YqgF family)